MALALRVLRDRAILSRLNLRSARISIKCSTSAADAVYPFAIATLRFNAALERAEAASRVLRRTALHLFRASKHASDIICAPVFVITLIAPDLLVSVTMLLSKVLDFLSKGLTTSSNVTSWTSSLRWRLA